MSARLLLVVGLAIALAAGCGGAREPTREVRLLAPVWTDADVDRFERESGCRVDLRVYDEGEPLETIAERRNVDVLARPALHPPVHETQEFVRVFLGGGVDVTVPKELGPTLGGRMEPAPPRSIVWKLRPEGDNEDCARRWLDYATSQ